MHHPQLSLGMLGNRQRCHYARNSRVTMTDKTWYYINDIPIWNQNVFRLWPFMNCGYELMIGFLWCWTQTTHFSITSLVIQHGLVETRVFLVIQHEAANKWQKSRGTLELEAPEVVPFCIPQVVRPRSINSVSNSSFPVKFNLHTQHPWLQLKLNQARCE